MLKKIIYFTYHKINSEHAYDMLSNLSTNKHNVITCLKLVHKNEINESI